MRVPDQWETMRIKCPNKEVFERFKYWLSDSEPIFSEDCEMGGVIPDGSHVTFDSDGGGNIVHIVLHNG